MKRLLAALGAFAGVLTVRAVLSPYLTNNEDIFVLVIALFLPWLVLREK